MGLRAEPRNHTKLGRRMERQRKRKKLNRQAFVDFFTAWQIEKAEQAQETNG